MNGRPSKLTPEIITKILDLVRGCVPVTVACRAAGVGYSTLKDWRTRGREEPESIYGEFAVALEEAVAVAEIEMVKAVYSAATSDPKSAQWMLERRFGGRWSPQQKTQAKVEHSGSMATAVTVYLPDNGRDP